MQHFKLIIIAITREISIGKYVPTFDLVCVSYQLSFFIIYQQLSLVILFKFFYGYSTQFHSSEHKVIKDIFKIKLSLYYNNNVCKNKVKVTYLI